MADTDRSLLEEELPLYFGEWLKDRRQKLDLTQAELAKRASCSVSALRKIERDERRPSKQLADLLAKALEIPIENQAAFIKVARGDLSVDCLRTIIQDRVSSPTGQSTPIPVSLPKPLTPFIGREPELTALHQLLHDPQCSLLSIIGPGGIGKTRLAIEAARQCKELFPDGVWFVPLVSLTSPALILSAIAEALNYKFQDPVNPQAELLRYLRTKKALLVIDNAEHLLDGVGVLAEILKACQQIKLLATSRERLNLLIEWIFEIQGLPVPSNEQVDQFESYSSVALFLQCARRAQSGFEIRADDQQWVLNICQAMEGMPLGIELSAAWVGMLSCEEIANEIRKNFDFLSASMRDLPERHRSLRATLDHSWKLLNAEEKLILSRLSVFHGRFRREAAQEICGASISILSSLKNKSLLYRTDQDYYALHEIIRQYADQKLEEDPAEYEQVRDRHAVYFVTYLSRCEKALQGSHQLETFDEMAQVINNLSQGWQHLIMQCRSNAGKTTLACAELVHSALFSISLFYEMRCRSFEAVALFEASAEYLKSVQGEFEETEDYSRYLSVLGHIQAYLGNHYIFIDQYEKGRKQIESAILLLEKTQASVEKSQAQVMLASYYGLVGRFQDSLSLLEEGRKIFMEAGERWWYLLCTTYLASGYKNLGRIHESEVLFQEVLQSVEPEDFIVGLNLRIDYAMVLMMMGEFDRAETLMQESLQLSYRFGNYRMTAEALYNFGRLELATCRYKLAEEYIQKSIKLFTEFGETHDLAPRRAYLGKCYAALSDHTAACDQYRQALRSAQDHGENHIVYFCLMNIARSYFMEGQSEKALEILLALRYFPIEMPRIKTEAASLLDELRAVLPKEQVEAAALKVDSEITPDPSGNSALAYAIERGCK